MAPHLWVALKLSATGRQALVLFIRDEVYCTKLDGVVERCIAAIECCSGINKYLTLRL